MLRSHDWVVYSTIQFAGAEHVLAYLGRCTHKTAVANHRLVDFDGEHVRFRWSGYSDGNKPKVMRLEADECIRRFLLNVRLRKRGTIHTTVSSASPSGAHALGNLSAPARFRRTGRAEHCRARPLIDWRRRTRMLRRHEVLQRNFSLAGP